MLLCLDVGNTHIFAGIVENKQILTTFRLNSDTKLTEDEYASKLFTIIVNLGYHKEEIEHVIISSVVPSIDQVLNKAFNKFFNLQPLFVAPGMKSGLAIKLDDPKQLGADLLVVGVAAYNKYGGNNIIIDLGTATKFIVVSKNAEYLGGAISPGITSSLKSLIASTAKLTDTTIETDIPVIGKNTSDAIQSGLIYGNVAMIDGMVARIMKQIGDANVIITGGNAHLVEHELQSNHIYEPNLILEGLIMLFYKNQK